MGAKNMFFPGFAGALVLVAVQQALIYITALLKPSGSGDKKKN